MSQKLNILIVDDVHECLMLQLTQMGINFRYSPNIKAGDIANELKSFTGIVVRSKFRLDKNFLECQPQLKLVARAGSGLDNIDLQFANNAGITCINAGEANADAVAEHAIGLLLALQHKIVKSNRELVERVWDREANRGVEVKGKTIGIIGYGNTGRALAEKLKGFGATVISYDRYKSGFANDYVEEVSLAKLEAQSDIISFHVPLTSETKHWISNAWFQKVKKPIVLLNLSRGGIMKIKDVTKAIASGKITHFASDVLENEILESYNPEERQVFDWLNNQANVILTPHVAGWTNESYVKISSVLADKIESLIRSDFLRAETHKKNEQNVG